MANGNTARYALIKPEVGADFDLWGTHLNTDWDSTDLLLGIPKPVRSTVVGGVIDLSLSIVQDAVVTSATVFSFANVPADITSPVTAHYSSIVYVRVKDGGSAPVTWPAEVTWLGGGDAPVLHTSGYDLILLATLDNGVTWHGAQLATDPPASSITTVALANLSVTEPKLAAGAVSRRALASGVGVYASLRHSAVQTTVNGTPKTLAWDTEDADTDTLHDTVTNNSRITIPTGFGNGTSIWLFEAQVQFANSGGEMSVAILKNGSLVARSGAAGVGGSGQAMQVTFIDRPADGDYYEVQVTQFAGTNVNITQGASSTFFKATRLAQ